MPSNDCNSGQNIFLFMECSQWIGNRCPRWKMNDFRRLGSVLRNIDSRPIFAIWSNRHPIRRDATSVLVRRTKSSARQFLHSLWELVCGQACANRLATVLSGLSRIFTDQSGRKIRGCCRLSLRFRRHVQSVVVCPNEGSADCRAHNCRGVRQAFCRGSNIRWIRRRGIDCNRTKGELKCSKCISAIRISKPIRRVVGVRVAVEVEGGGGVHRNRVRT